jgi:hypothetical protein
VLASSINEALFPGGEDLVVHIKKDGTVLFRNDVQDGAKWCRIGILKDGILVIWKSASNIFQRYNSAGFAKELITGVPFKKLRLCISDGRILETSREFFIAHSFTIREFGWEEQFHLRLSHFGMDKVDECEKSKEQLKEKSPLRQIMDELEKQKRKRQMEHS